MSDVMRGMRSLSAWESVLTGQLESRFGVDLLTEAFFKVDDAVFAELKW